MVLFVQDGPILHWLRHSEIRVVGMDPQELIPLHFIYST